jgi:hypothetical protein
MLTYAQKEYEHRLTTETKNARQAAARALEEEVGRVQALLQLLQREHEQRLRETTCKLQVVAHEARSMRP